MMAEKHKYWTNDTFETITKKYKNKKVLVTQGPYKGLVGKIVMMRSNGIPPKPYKDWWMSVDVDIGNKLGLKDVPVLYITTAPANAEMSGPKLKPGTYTLKNL